MTPASGTLPATSRVGRVALDVEDLDRTAAFYEDVVGLSPLGATEERATLGADGRPLLELRHAPDAGPRPREAAGLFHVAFRVPNRAALGDALARIEDSWGLDGASDHRVSEALYLTDPEDNGVEVYCDRPREDWSETDDGRVAMVTRPLDRDPIRERASGAATVPAGTDVGHVHLEVTDIPPTRAFYVDALGLSVRQTYGTEALFMAAGDYHHHVGANVWNGRTAPASGRGLAWVELVVPEAAIPAARDRLREAGHEATETPAGVDVRDPDGIALRLVPPA